MENKENSKIYKYLTLYYISNLWIVSMIPGDRKVAGCLSFSSKLDGISVFNDDGLLAKFNKSLEKNTK